MTFDNDEVNNKSLPHWISKTPLGEEMASERYTVTSENLLKSVRTRYNLSSGGMENEFATGVCSCCGRPFENERSFVQCYFGDLVCMNCKNDYHSRSICRRHVESLIGSKEEAMILISIAFGIKRDVARRLTGLSSDEISDVKSKLITREYIVIKSVGLFFNKIKITFSAKEAIRIMASTYSRDSDFKEFLENIGWNAQIERR